MPESLVGFIIGAIVVFVPMLFLVLNYRQESRDNEYNAEARWEEVLRLRNEISNSSSPRSAL